MDWETMESILRLARSAGDVTIDITGGAPEMHPNFRRFVSTARAQGSDVIVRTNLTILLEPCYEDVPGFSVIKKSNWSPRFPVTRKRT